MTLERSKEFWLNLIRDEPDCPIGAGVPTAEDRLWTIQQYAALGIEQTNDTGPLADLFAAIHREAAGGLTSTSETVNEATQSPSGDSRPR